MGSKEHDECTKKLAPKVERIWVYFLFYLFSLFHFQTAAATAAFPNLGQPCGHRGPDQILARTVLPDETSPQAPWPAVVYLPGITPLMSLSGLTQFFCVMYRISFFAASNCWVAISHRRDSGNILQRHKGNGWMASNLFHCSYVLSGQSGWALVRGEPWWPDPCLASSQASWNGTSRWKQWIVLWSECWFLYPQMKSYNKIYFKL